MNAPHELLAMKQQLVTLHQTLDSALSELRDLLAQDETIEAALTCELLGSAVDQLLALESLVAKPDELQAVIAEMREYAKQYWSDGPGRSVLNDWADRLDGEYRRLL